MSHIQSSSIEPGEGLIYSRLREQQFAALKRAASIVYRARNEARNIKNGVGNSEWEECPIAIKFLTDLHVEIRELLFTEIAILPPRLFHVLHRQGHLLHHFCECAQEAARQMGRQFQFRDDAMKRVEDSFVELNLGYQQMVAAIHESLGVSG